MDGLFKLIFYIIIGIVWVISNNKKQTLWKEEQNSDFPAQRPQANPLPKPRMDQPFSGEIFPEAVLPSREGLSSKPEQPAIFKQFKESYYDKKFEMKKKRLQAKKQSDVPAISNTSDLKINLPEQEKKASSIPAIVANRRKKQSYHLKSSLKEGIIWSIVLGAPRSKQALNWQTGPLNR